MATAKRLPSGSYRIRVYSHNENGRKVYISITAATKKEAELKAAELNSNRKRISLSDLTVLEAVKEYIKIKREVLSPSTIRGYETTLSRFECIGSTKIKQLDNKTVQSFINTLSKDLAPKTVRNIYTLFVSAVSLQDPELTFRVTLPQKAQRIKKAPSDEEVKQIFDKSSGEIKKAIFFSMMGLRRGEICAVEYEDIKDDYIHIHRDMIRGSDGWIIKDIPKTSESERLVLLPDNFRDIIGSGSGRIVNRAPGTITERFHSIALSFGLDLHLHDMRHYFVSMAHAMGIPDRFIMAMGGFKSDYVMKSVYRNTIDDLEKEYRAKYAKKISNI